MEYRKTSKMEQKDDKMTFSGVSWKKNHLELKKELKG